MLVVVALAVCLGGAAWLRLLAQSPTLDLTASADAQGRVVLGGGGAPESAALAGRVLQGLGSVDGPVVAVDPALLHRAPRWWPADARRAEASRQHQALAAALAAGAVRLQLDDGSAPVLPARPRGLAGLGLWVWPLVLGTLLLPLFGCVVLMARPSLPSALLAGVCVAQAGGLALVATASLRGIGLPPLLWQIDLPLRLGLDLLVAAATVQVFALAGRPRWAGALWAVAALGLAAVASGRLPQAWAFGQLLALLLGGAAVWAVWPRSKGPPDPRRRVAAQLALTALVTWLLANAVVLAGALRPGLMPATAAAASVAWTLFLTSLLLLAPFVSRSRRLLRELALLAATSTLAAALDLLFVAVFSANATASVAAALFVALAAYAFVRQRLIDHLLGARLHSTDRIFELLYRAARDVQRQPERQLQRLAQLLRELFEPLEMTRTAPVPPHAQVQGGGTALVVPLRPDGDEGRPGLAVRLHLAERGQRLFVPEDARLADRLVEQLRRAVAYDRAVERGRHEERQRLAQDLHDDIGARLLTLMYQAPTPELEDYIRHTLQDLKTLTRGLAVAEHRLGPAAAEWKSGIAQRLAAAQAQLGWSCQVDESQVLSVGQWSALTRVLRELVSNALYHGRATRVEVSLEQDGPALLLSVADDGIGRDPAAWSHGLGLGGVRKRVKQLGGRVAWRENGARGIVCEVRIEQFRERA